MKSLNIKSRTIIALCLFAVLFVSLVLVATYCDFQVSKILTKNALKPGEYLANDLFGVEYMHGDTLLVFRKML